MCRGLFWSWRIHVFYHRHVSYSLPTDSTRNHFPLMHCGQELFHITECKCTQTAKVLCCTCVGQSLYHTINLPPGICRVFTRIIEICMENTPKRCVLFKECWHSLCSNLANDYKCVLIERCADYILLKTCQTFKCNRKGKWEGENVAWSR